jgi:cytochrome P450 / NADPH-cytochrome P450 reductase
MADPKENEQEVTIPQPPPSWLLGNLPDVDVSQMALSVRHLYKLYGPIFRIDIAGAHFVRLGSQELIHEVMDDERFEKKVSGALWEVRHITGTGLFTSDTEEHVSPAAFLKCRKVRLS